VDPHGIGVFGESLHSDGYGVVGFGFGASGTGVRGSGSLRGMVGTAGAGCIGVLGRASIGGIGVFGAGDEDGIGVRGTSGSGASYAAFFSGFNGDLIGADKAADFADPDFLVDSDGNVTATSFSISSFGTTSASNTSAPGSILSSPPCGSGALLIGGGCDCSGGTVKESYPNGTVWRCQCSAAGVEAYNLCLISPGP
jgi:hypothetical protein